MPLSSRFRRGKEGGGNLWCREEHTKREILYDSQEGSKKTPEAQYFKGKDEEKSSTIWR